MKMKVIGSTVLSSKGEPRNAYVPYSLLELKEIHDFGGIELVWVEP